MADLRDQIDDWLYLPPGTCYEPEITPDMAGALREVLVYADRLSEPQRTALHHAIATGAGLLAAEPAVPVAPREWQVGDICSTQFNGEHRIFRVTEVRRGMARLTATRRYPGERFNVTTVRKLAELAEATDAAAGA